MTTMQIRQIWYLFRNQFSEETKLKSVSDTVSGTTAGVIAYEYSKIRDEMTEDKVNDI